MSFLPAHAQRTLAQLEINRSHYLEMKKQFPGAYQAVAIGSSLTNANIDCTDELLTLSLEKYGDSIVVSKIYSPGRPLLLMSRYGKLFETLLENPPDLLFLERDMMTFAFRDSIEKKAPPAHKLAGTTFLSHAEGMYIQLRDALMSNRLNLISALQVKNYEQPEPFSSQACYPIAAKAIQADTLGMDLRKRVVFPYRSVAVFIQSDIQKLQALGTEVILLHQPRPQSLEMLYEKEAESAQIEKLTEQYQQELGIAYWHCPIAFSFSQFADRAHMNQKGRKIYSAWLLDNIHNQLP